MTDQIRAALAHLAAAGASDIRDHVASDDPALADVEAVWARLRALQQVADDARRERDALRIRVREFLVAGPEGRAAYVPAGDPLVDGLWRKMSGMDDRHRAALRHVEEQRDAAREALAAMRDYLTRSLDETLSMEGGLEIVNALTPADLALVDRWVAAMRRGLREMTFDRDHWRALWQTWQATIRDALGMDDSTPCLEDVVSEIRRQRVGPVRRWLASLRRDEREGGGR